MANSTDDAANARPKIDRQTTTPFHLKLFYRQHAFHQLSDFPVPSPSPSSDASSHPTPALPPHLQIYTWQSCTLHELAQLLTSALPNLLPSPTVGSRLCFRLIYPDTRNQAVAADGRGRYLSKDVGSVIVGRSSSSGDEQANGQDGKPAGGIKLQGDDADKTLQDARFVIGDYVDCAILPPLADGSIAPAIVSRGGGAGSSVIGGGMRAFGPPIRENGYGRPRGPGGFGGPGGQPSVPSGEWRRGERVPDSGGRGFGRGPRNRGRPY
ncbi:hypothetical protein AJ80_03216 [Polytolypa hystricis UAMH7299]|uniref:Sin3-associated polypeptide Sap18 n=1 Tax=Polytolypa hystricis (strain UAMH7299) TaxID=1447883 RepID=A0A2B7YJE7_POLH7|nr:hypothetical protein AJ80_03216 [Polytolypa hystricis UAMH7299]